jgi:probable rRNA maturation factor
MIEFFTEDVILPDFDQVSVSNWLSDVCNSEDKVLNELNIIFCSDEHLLKMNIDHLEHDYYTDIITFDYCFDNQIIGDLFVSVDRVSHNANSNNVLLFNELSRVMVHGVLHLCGFKDKSPEEATLMRSKENHYLSLYVPRET